MNFKQHIIRAMSVLIISLDTKITLQWVVCHSNFQQFYQGKYYSHQDSALSTSAFYFWNNQWRNSILPCSRVHSLASTIRFLRLALNTVQLMFNSCFLLEARWKGRTLINSKAAAKTNISPGSKATTFWRCKTQGLWKKGKMSAAFYISETD